MIICFQKNNNINIIIAFKDIKYSNNQFLEDHLNNLFKIMILINYNKLTSKIIIKFVNYKAKILINNVKLNICI